MTWGNQHNTAKCSILHRDAISVAAEQCLDILCYLYHEALQYASPQGVAYVAAQIPLPPHEFQQEQDQLSEPGRERRFSWGSPWLKDRRLVRQWQDEQTYAFCNTWFANIDRDYDPRYTMQARWSACRRGTELATALDMALEDAQHQTSDSDVLASTFSGKLEALLRHFGKGCCVVPEGGAPTESRHDGPREVFFATRHFISDAHLGQLENEIDRLSRCWFQMRAEARGLKKARMLNQNRAYQLCKRGTVSLMKSLGLGSPLREVCDLDYEEIPVDSSECWHIAGTPSSVVLVPQPGQEVGQQQLEAWQSRRQDPPKKTWTQDEIRW